LRNHLFDYLASSNYQYYQEGRKSEYEQEEYLKNIEKLTSSIQHNIKSFGKLKNNGYRGSIIDSMKNLETLKKLGVKTAISLYPLYDYEGEDKCKKEGIEYFYIEMPPDFNNIDSGYCKKFVKFSELTKQGNFILGCEFGTYKTNFAMTAYKILNPHNPLLTHYDQDYEINYTDWINIVDIYETLSADDKKELGYTSEVEEEIIKSFELRGIY
ncbi:MAG TPA: hypothetical protein PLG15_05905, partial [Candidatus Gastranaerophilaceae bacterium]|nr:hypothetical protein [Candidatus Gastranaerophilaceae bacterium]